jgi:hypothetical protein
MGDTQRGIRVTAAFVTLAGGLTFSAYAAMLDMDGAAVGMAFAAVAGFVGMLASPLVTTSLMAAGWAIALAATGRFGWGTVMAVYGMAVAVGWRIMAVQTAPRKPHLTLVRSS